MASDSKLAIDEAEDYAKQQGQLMASQTYERDPLHLDDDSS